MRARISGLLVKEFLQFLRSRLMLFLILWLYTIEVVICTVALTFEVRDMPLAVLDLDHTPESRALEETFLVSDTFAYAGTPATARDAERWLQEGRARIALIIPEGYYRDITRGASPAVQLLIDGTNSNMAAQARGYALAIVSGATHGAHPSQPPPGAQAVTRVWYNPDQTYTAFMVLSMIALAAFMVGVIHPAASIVREVEAGTIEQLRVTPIRTAEVFLAKTTPTLVMGLLALFPSLLIVWWFDVPMRGSLVLFLALTALFLLSAIAFGVLVACVSNSLQQALLLSFFGLFPLMFLSGTLAPVESMPEILQGASLASPLRHYMDVILGIFLKGAGWADLWPQALSLVAIGIPLFAVAAWIFARRWG